MEKPRTDLFTPLTPTSEARNIILAMGEGNPGGMTVMVDVIEHQGLVLGFETLRTLDDMNIRGQQVWVAYKYFCEEDMGAFIRAVEARNPAMVEYVNKLCFNDDFPHKAVVSGGAGTRPPQA